MCPLLGPCLGWRLGSLGRQEKAVLTSAVHKVNTARRAQQAGPSLAAQRPDLVRCRPSGPRPAAALPPTDNQARKRKMQLTVQTAARKCTTLPPSNPMIRCFGLCSLTQSNVSALLPAFLLLIRTKRLFMATEVAPVLGTLPRKDGIGLGTLYV